MMHTLSIICMQGMESQPFTAKFDARVTRIHLALRGSEV